MKLKESDQLQMSWFVIYSFVKLWCQWLMYYNIVWIITCVRSDIIHLTFRKSDIVYSSSVAFLAIPNLVDISQNFILLSIGLSLGAVVMGFNAKLEEKLLLLQDDLIQNPKYTNPSLFLSWQLLILILLVLARKSWYYWRILWSSTMQPCYSLCFAFLYLCWCSQHMKYIIAFSCRNSLQFHIFSFS